MGLTFMYDIESNEGCHSLMMALVVTLVGAMNPFQLLFGCY